MSFLRSTYHHKKDGFTLILTMGLSLLVLAITLTIIAMISRSYDRHIGIERSNQFFYAAESGAEIAFFEHNRRKWATGLVFNNQELKHKKIGGVTKWSIQGRSTPVVDILKEFTKIEIPLYWDNQSNPSNNSVIKVDEINHTNTNFTLTFYNNEIGASVEVLKKYKKQFSNEIPDISSFSFGENTKDEVLIHWSVSGKNKTSEVNQTFESLLTNEPCDTINDRSTILCENKFNSNYSIINSNDTTILGRISPCHQTNPEDCKMNLPTFLSKIKQPKIRIQTLLSFSDSNKSPTDYDYSIRGIPYSLVLNNGNDIEIPQTYYTLKSEVEMSDYSDSINIRVPERMSTGAFSYMVFD